MTKPAKPARRLGTLLSAVVLAACGSQAQPSPAPGVAGRGGPSGTLYLANAAPGALTIIDPASGRSRTQRVAELRPGDPPYPIAIVGGRLVVYGGEVTYAVDLAVRGPARSLGESWFFLPSAAAGRVWLALLDPRSPDTVRGLRGVREVSVGGRVTLARSARPPRWPIAALDNGLVLQTTDGLVLWDPLTGRVVRRLPGLFPVAARGSMLVSCGHPGCPVLYVTDSRSGRETQIRPSRGFHFDETYGGAFSPDGSELAVPAMTSAGRRQVAVVNLRRRAARLVGGAPLGVYEQIAWSASGWLYYGAPAGRIAAYGPGSAAAVLLRQRVAPFVKMVAN